MSNSYCSELCIYKSLTSVSEPLEVIIKRITMFLYPPGAIYKRKETNLKVQIDFLVSVL